MPRKKPDPDLTTSGLAAENAALKKQVQDLLKRANQPASSQSKVPDTGRSGDKVTVASKLPMALELQLCRPTEIRMKYKQESWTEQVWAKTGKIVTIAGCAYPNGSPPEGMEWPDRPQMFNGFALTFGVDKEFFDRWLEQNKTSPIVANGLVYAHCQVESIKAFAREHKELVSGLHPLKKEVRDPETGKVLVPGDSRMAKKLVAGKPRKAVTASEEGDIIEDVA